MTCKCLYLTAYPAKYKPHFLTTDRWIKDAGSLPSLYVWHICLEINGTTNLSSSCYNNPNNKGSIVYSALAAAPRNARSPGESAVTQTLTRRRFGGSSFWSVRTCGAPSVSTLHKPPPVKEGFYSPLTQQCPTSLLDYKLWSFFFHPRTCERRVRARKRAFQRRLQHCCHPAEPCQPDYWLLSCSYLPFTHGKRRTFFFTVG